MLSLLRTADGLLRRASVDAEGIRQRLIAVDREAESFSSRLDIRRKNVSMAVAFFRLAETVSNSVEAGPVVGCNLFIYPWWMEDACR